MHVLLAQPIHTVLPMLIERQRIFGQLPARSKLQQIPPKPEVGSSPLAFRPCWASRSRNALIGRETWKALVKIFVIVGIAVKDARTELPNELVGNTGTVPLFWQRTVRPKEQFVLPPGVT